MNAVSGTQQQKHRTINRGLLLATWKTPGGIPAITEKITWLIL